MKVTVHNSTSDFNSYRANRVKSLFNAESGADFRLEAEMDLTGDWQIGVIVGPSGSGKTSLGRQLWGDEAFWTPEWPVDQPIVDAISPGGAFDGVTGALAAVGLGSVPVWLRPYSVLSNGEKFRADLARLVCDEPEKAVVDEFTSVVDRQIARFGALAFAKAWRRTGGRVILLTPHADVLDWLEPDWVFDTGAVSFQKEGLWRRPSFELEIRQTDGRYWPLFEPHYYLKLPRPIAANYYVGTVEGEPVAHMVVATKNNGKGKGAFEGRGTRLVIMPEWQGAGVGMRFLNAVCQLWWEGRNRYANPCTTVFHTSHPGLCAGLRRSKNWHQVSAVLYGGNKVKSRSSMDASTQGKVSRAGYGGHFRAVQGFRYYGTPETFGAGLEGAV